MREYLFPGLLPGEEGEYGQPRQEYVHLFNGVNQVVMPDGRVVIAEWVDLTTESDTEENWCLVIPGWIRTTPWRINTGQLRISVLPLNPSEQHEYEVFIRKRLRAEKARIVFWKLEE